MGALPVNIATLKLEPISKRIEPIQQRNDIIIRQLWLELKLVMMKVRVSKKIKANKADLWNILADYGNIYRFHPMLSDSRLIEGSTVGELGATRQCDMNDGKNYIKERITSWKEGESYKVDIYEGSLPFKKATGKLGVVEIDSENTEAYMEVEFTASNPLMSPMMYMMYKTKVIPSILNGLEKLNEKNSNLSFA